MFALRLIITFGFVATWASIANSQSDEPVVALNLFETKTGECELTKSKDMTNQFLKSEGLFRLPKSYTVTSTSIFRRRGISQPTGKKIAPLKPVACLADDNDKVLVTTLDSNDRSCGWILKEDLAIVEQTTSSPPPCGEVKPLSVSEFCKKTESLGASSSEINLGRGGCEIPGIKSTLIDTKFITDNTTSRLTATTENSELARRNISIFSTANSETPSGSVEIFSLNKVYDAVVKDGNSIRVLIGNDIGPTGWADLDDGHIWYSTLTTYFKQNGKKSVYLNKILKNAAEGSNQVLATKPPEQNFNVAEEYVKFPVLFDMRKKNDFSPERQAPQLEVAFIGKFCTGSSGKMCSSDESEYGKALSNLRAADVVFLIDGSKSMREYFGIVAENLTNFTEEYIGNSNYRFGVAMYGDFKSTDQTSMGDPIDYKIIMDLEANYEGNFSPVENAELLIFDAMKDKPEAAYTAVHKTANIFDWAREKPHFLIHIADHGDRERPSQKVFSAMLKNNIFYVPIAVEGEAVLKESDTFISDSKVFAREYRSPEGNNMAVEAIKSYGNSASSAREEIAKALRDATAGFPNLGEEASQGDILPMLTDAAREIFKIPENDDIQVLAATGYVETVSLGSVEKNWEYFVSLGDGDAASLQREMEGVCLSLGDGNSVKTIETTVINMVRLLTGDKKSATELTGIFARGEIPLQTKTIIGEGIWDLLSDAGADQDLTKYKKEFCRSSALLKYMLKNRKPKDAKEGVDMTWDGVEFKIKGHKKFKWKYTDLAGRTRYYVPLSYLPRPQT